LVALVLAGNAFVRLQRGQPVKNQLRSGATWVALGVSGLGFAVGLYRVLLGPAA
jgi:hypothetical protein